MENTRQTLSFEHRETCPWEHIQAAEEIDLSVLALKQQNPLWLGDPSGLKGCRDSQVELKSNIHIPSLAGRSFQMHRSVVVSVRWTFIFIPKTQLSVCMHTHIM